MFDLTGKTALVTGATGAIGGAAAAALKGQGARLIVVGSTQERADDAAQRLGADAAIGTDLSDRAAVDTLASEAEKAGPVDILVNNAGVSVHEPAGRVTEDGLDMTLNVNVRNLILLTDALSDSLKSRKGNVVNISSVSASTGSIGQIAYSASKGAVNSMTRNMSIDLGRAGVRVNAVAPGVIDDGMWTTAFESGAVDREKTMAGISKVIPLEGRWGSAQNIADAVAFLASENADYITGQVLRVDGGILA